MIKDLAVHHVVVSHDVDGGNEFSCDNEANEANESNEEEEEEEVQLKAPDAESEQGAGARESTKFEPDEDDIYGSGDPIDEEEAVGAGRFGSSTQHLLTPPTSMAAPANAHLSSSTDNGSQSSSQGVQNVAAWAGNYTRLYGLTDIRDPSVEIPFTAHNWGSYTNPLATPITYVPDVFEEEREEERQEEEEHGEREETLPPLVQSPDLQNDDWYPYQNRDLNHDNDECGW
ncbi:hypothetical protein N0V93_006949 [Gnomoniopsis smithogilvyi]|uniref:Uncharacterized protein n=1 Tax=Gnomoniopsis smithogilvyi TaxID=1191159 RepID=A0A9W9CW48_9PEZI|nr:hypothetical protein N0V93_006949 [Gnomoniopsis smithogilvyi]